MHSFDMGCTWNVSGHFRKLEFMLLINSGMVFKHPALWQYTFGLMNLDRSVCYEQCPIHL